MSFPAITAVHPRATMFSTITKNSDAYTQILQWESSTRSETSVNGNWGNATTIKILKVSLRQSTHSKYI